MSTLRIESAPRADVSEASDARMPRRHMLRLMATGCAYCLAAGRLAAEPAHGGDAAAAHPPHWGYAGASGPEHWGELQPDFKVCQLGLEQAPIDLAEGIKGDPGEAKFAYRAMPLRIVNNGHTVQVNVDPGCACTIGGAKYELLQYHFHHPSEHLLAGRAIDLECHFVHRSSAGAIAVVGVFIKPGAANKALAAIFDAMPAKEGPEISVAAPIDPAALMPESSGYFRYMGSLTTPPCSEGLTWTVFKKPIEASPQQIQQFAALFPNNARPVQTRNRRFLIDVD
jgi:carbonic anhydrase